jgi:hypothetical protein
MKHFLDLLNANGFVPADQVKHFGKVIPYVYYAFRVRNGVHEYVSLVFYEGKFVEAVYELYMAEKNTYRVKGTPKQSERAKRGFASLTGSLLRSYETLLSFVTKTDEQAKEEASRMFNLLLQAERKQ